MPAATFVAMFLMGLAGGVHCAAMCGGFIASAASAPAAPGWQRIAWHRRIGAGHAVTAHPALWMNLGRLATYAALGAAFAGIASIGRFAPAWIPVQTALFVAANALLIVYGIGLIGREAGVRRIEAAGMRVHEAVDRLLGRLSLSGAARRVAVGIAWGFVPCGLVYSALAIAALSGDAADGASLMAAFGAGTLPAILGAQAVIGAVKRLAGAPSQRTIRAALGVALLAFGIVGLARAAGLDGAERLLAFCLPGHG